ncbi:MAG: proteasome subunit beta [Candidatus Woesearchaeota archaeon]
MEEKILKTGTTTVGLVTKEGIILGTDKRATAGYLIVDKKAQKLHKITDTIALTIAGSVSDAQKIISLVKAEIKFQSLRILRPLTATEVAYFLSNIVYQKIREFSTIESVAHFILAGLDNGTFSLYDIFPDGSVTKIDDFVSSGSGSVFAYGVLETNYDKNLTIEEGKKLVVKAINAALQRDIASGNGIELLVVDKNGVNFVDVSSIKLN